MRQGEDGKAIAREKLGTLDLAAVPGRPAGGYSEVEHLSVRIILAYIVGEGIRTVQARAVHGPECCRMPTIGHRGLHDTRRVRVTGQEHDAIQLVFAEECQEVVHRRRKGIPSVVLEREARLRVET